MAHSYFPKSNNPKREKALAMAKARGEAAEEWLKNNKLTKDTQPEFNALMKSIDKQFK